MHPLFLICALLTFKRKQKTVTTDTGIASYFYMVKTPAGKIRRMETMARSLSQAEEFSNREVEAYKGKIIAKVKLARKYEWQRIE